MTKKALSKLIKFYRHKHPKFAQENIRALIILNDPKRFPENGSEVRKLDRYLHESFNYERTLNRQVLTLQDKLNKLKEIIVDKELELKRLNKRVSWTLDYLELARTEEEKQRILNWLWEYREKRIAEMEKERQEEQTNIIKKAKD